VECRKVADEFLIGIRSEVLGFFAALLDLAHRGDIMLYVGLAHEIN
jgi:hypothetical protein